MISLASETYRFESSSSKLKAVGIYPTLFHGTDGRDWNVSQAYLDKAIAWDSTARQDKPGSKHARVVQALADSHRRALIAAQHRNYTWTAILEDDAIPIDEGMLPNWPDNFERIWEMLPKAARFVRLGYCNPGPRPDYTVQTFVEGQPFRITNWLGYLIDKPGNPARYFPGLCTTAYMVHKEFIPEVLKLFPCPASIDRCYLKFFDTTWEGQAGGLDGKGVEFLFNIETNKPVEKAYEDSKGLIFGVGVRQFGVLKQDWEALPNGTTQQITGEPDEYPPSGTAT